MVKVDKTAKTNIVVFHIMYDQHSGEIAVGRIFSGVVRKGTEFNISGRANTQKVQQVGDIHGPGQGNSGPAPSRKHSSADRTEGHISR